MLKVLSVLLLLAVASHSAPSSKNDCHCTDTLRTHYKCYCTRDGKTRWYSGVPAPGPGVVIPPGCYSRSSSVVLDDGEVIKMEDLKVGQAVQVTDPEGKPGTSKFVGWLEKHRFNTNLVKLTTESGNVLTMTGELSSPSSNDTDNL